MKIGIEGIGLWAHGLTSWQGFSAGLTDGFSVPAESPGKPAPTGIPARERRRAPLSVKLAIEVINQAATMSEINEQDMCSVFSSAMGDNHITDYICRTLAADKLSLSPTKFHNSVHNTASGYWSISTGNRLPSTFISAFTNSFPVALLEAAALAIDEAKPTALALYDVAFGQPLYDICPASEDFAAAFILTPEPTTARWVLDLNIEATTEQNAAAQPDSETAFIKERLHNNPAALALTLCELLAGQQPATLRWPLSKQSCLSAQLH
jgi:hypothetical protein